MIFRRKNKKSDAPQAERRQQYRRTGVKSQALSVGLRRPQGPPIPGQLIDVSAGGAAVAFPGENPALQEGKSVGLVFNSLLHGGQVVVDAQLVTVSQSGPSQRYSFQFHDPGSLFRQLDDYFFKYFNRRRVIRVRPALDSGISVKVFFGMGAMTVQLSDVTLDGIGLLMSAADGSMFTDVTDLRAEFTLPKSSVSIAWMAKTVHVTGVKRGVLLGGAFKLQPSPELEVQRQTLAKYSEARVADMARWDTAY